MGIFQCKTIESEKNFFAICIPAQIIVSNLYNINKNLHFHADTHTEVYSPKTVNKNSFRAYFYYFQSEFSRLKHKQQ